MAMFSMKYNASGNYDGTAYNAMMDMAKPGEIWTTSQGNEVLILKNHGTLCSMLKLLENQPYHDDDCIEVVSRQLRYTNPCMVAYIFNQGLCEYIKSIPEEQYTQIMQTVADRLNVTIRVNKEEAPAPELEAMKARAESLYQAMEKMQVKHACEMERLEKALAESKEKCGAYEKRMIEMDGRTQADPAAAVYKQLYHELLDRIIAGGGTK